MIPRLKVLVQVSFTKVVSIVDLAAKHYYTKMFKLDPDIAPFFRMGAVVIQILLGT